MKPTYDSDKWLAQKARIMAARGGLCEDCGILAATDLHHTYYIPRKPYDEYVDDALKLLCRECHELTTEALISLNSTFGRFTGGQIVDVSSAVQLAIAETGDARAVGNWICLCLADIRKVQVHLN